MAKKKPLKSDFKAVTEWQDTNCGVKNAGTAVATNQAEWEKLWAAINSNRYPQEKAPKLPKGKMAIAIFDGTSSKPADISIMKVEESDKQVTVSYKIEYTDSMLCMMFNCYSMQLIKKSDKPVVFSKVKAEVPKSDELPSFKF